MTIDAWTLCLRRAALPDFHFVGAGNGRLAAFSLCVRDETEPLSPGDETAGDAYLLKCSELHVR